LLKEKESVDGSVFFDLEIKDFPEPIQKKRFFFEKLSLCKIIKLVFKNNELWTKGQKNLKEVQKDRENKVLK